MSDYPKLNLPAIKLRASVREGSNCIWDELRGSWLVLTPEEWVRQHVIGWLRGEVGVLPADIMQEYPVSIEGMPQRADIVVTQGGCNPVMLVECKCADIKIDKVVLNQAVRYNQIIGARYIMLTNGLSHYFYETTDGVNYTPMNAIPPLK